jgi:integrase/recombinase XerD
MTTNKQVMLHITPSTTIAPAITAYEFFLTDQGRSHHTIKAFSSDLQLLQNFFQPDKTLDSITTIDLNNFLEWLQNERGIPCSPKTLSRRVTSLKSFFKWLSKNAVLALDPAEKVIQRTVLSPLPKVLSDTETDSALITAGSFRRKAKPDARPYALLLLLLNSGIKKNECLGIHINHIDLNGPDGPILKIRYQSPASRYKERDLLLPIEWIDVFHEYVAQYQPTDNLFPWSPRRLEYILEDISEDAGVEKHISFDMCRWTFALNKYKDGVDQNKIRQDLGVSPIQWRELSNKLGKLALQEN